MMKIINETELLILDFFFLISQKLSCAYIFIVVYKITYVNNRSNSCIIIDLPLIKLGITPNIIVLNK